LIQTTTQAAQVYTPQFETTAFRTALETIAKANQINNSSTMENELRPVKEILASLIELVNQIAKDLIILSGFGVCARHKLKGTDEIDQVLDAFADINNEILEAGAPSIELSNGHLSTDVHKIGLDNNGFRIMSDKVARGKFKLYFNNTPPRLKGNMSTVLLQDTKSTVNRLQKASLL
jgi:hypothetical protein